MSERSWWRQPWSGLWTEVRHTANSMRWDYDQYEDYVLAVTEAARKKVDTSKPEVRKVVEAMAVEAAQWSWDNLRELPAHVEAGMKKYHPNKYIAAPPREVIVDDEPSMIFDDL